MGTVPLHRELYGIPGMDAAVETFENEFLLDDMHHVLKRGALLDKDSTDSGNTGNTSFLRKGLLLGYDRANDIWGPWTPHTPNSTTNNYFHTIDGILAHSVDLTNLTADRLISVVTMGRVQTDRLVVAGDSTIGLRNSAYRFMAGRQLNPNILFDSMDYALTQGVVYIDDDTAGAPTLTNYQNGTTFVFTGANAVTLTLPAPVPGLQYTFKTYGTGDITINAATAGDIVGVSAADDTITLTNIEDCVTIMGITTAATPTHKWVVTGATPVAASFGAEIT